MPVRRRVDRRRTDDVRAWAMFMESGRDYFEDLAAVGLTEQSARPLAEETWRRIGADVIAYLGEFYRGYQAPERPYWAEREFGAPKRRRRVG